MKNILIVEDDQNIAKALSIRLKNAGYEVNVAPDALAGVETAIKKAPDLVLLDIALPAGNGFMVAERIQSLIPKAMPLIFLTASKKPGLRDKAKEFGAVAFFQKPYEWDDLLGAIQLALAGVPVVEEIARPCALKPVFKTRRATQNDSNRITTNPMNKTNEANNERHMKKILIVEDDQNIAKALAIRLKSAGYEVTVAPDAMIGVATALKFQPDLALLDISVPAGNGFTVAEKIQELVVTATPVIFLTASKLPGLREQAESLGAAAFFEKPYDADELLAAIERALSAAEVIKQ